MEDYREVMEEEMYWAVMPKVYDKIISAKKSMSQQVSYYLIQNRLPLKVNDKGKVPFGHCYAPLRCSCVKCWEVNDE
jgi:hypothetical protein